MGRLVHQDVPAPAVVPSVSALGRQPAAGRFTTFARDAEPRLRRALIGTLGPDATHDAVAHALAYAWENWAKVEPMDNPVGYLYRVGRSSARQRRPATVRFLITEEARIPEVEPGLVAALDALTPQQRNAVWLVHACEWSYQETADALGISASAVGTHVGRGLEKLRATLGGVT